MSVKERRPHVIPVVLVGATSWNQPVEHVVTPRGALHPPVTRVQLAGHTILMRVGRGEEKRDGRGGDGRRVALLALPVVHVTPRVPVMRATERQPRGQFRLPGGA